MLGFAKHEMALSVGDVVVANPYGLTWDSVNDTYIRTGDDDYTQVQRNMRRCALNSDGTVNYFLDANDSTLKEDGVTPSVLDGTDGNIMVQIPKFWYKYTNTVGGLRTAEICATATDGFEVHPAFFKDGVEVDYRYYRAYTGHYDGTKLASASGFTPYVNITRSTSRTRAQANGAGWGLTDWQILHAVQLLLLIEIGTFNSQSVLGDGNSTSLNYTTISGVSNSIGNQSTGHPSDNWMSYRGIENLYADVWEWIDGINVSDREVYISVNQSTFSDNVTTGDYISSGITLPLTGYQRDINFGLEGFLATSTDGASGETYVTDYSSSDTGLRVVRFGGDAGLGDYCGSFFINAISYSSDSRATTSGSISF